VRRFLREFLSDPDVVPLPRIVWLPILHGLVLPLRSRSSAELYARIWSTAGSPLLLHARAQCAGIAERLGSDYRAAIGMRYGTPSIAEGIDALATAGCGRIVLVPMFPQESFSTSGSVRAETERLLRARTRAPELRTARSFCDAPGYVHAVAARVRGAVSAAKDGKPDHHVFSFHGLPESSIARGDPYRGECERTARALARELGLDASDWTLSFQSRFGRKWLRPFTDEVVRDLAGSGRRVLVATPGFAADCLETLEEIGLRLAETYVAAGGPELTVVPALNEEPLWLDFLAGWIRQARDAS
jgi:ferrochelatase